VHSTRLERIGDGLAAGSSGMVAAHLDMVIAVEASAYENSDVGPGNSVAASRMEDVVHALVGEPWSGL
jgi:hypothetical protein